MDPDNFYFMPPLAEFKWRKFNQNFSVLANQRLSLLAVLIWIISNHSCVKFSHEEKKKAALCWCHFWLGARDATWNILFGCVSPCANCVLPTAKFDRTFQFCFYPQYSVPPRFAPPQRFRMPRDGAQQSTFCPLRQCLNFLGGKKNYKEMNMRWDTVQFWCIHLYLCTAKGWLRMSATRFNIR